MKTRLCYIPELNDFVRVQIIAKHSDGNCSCLIVRTKQLAELLDLEDVGHIFEMAFPFTIIHASTMEVPFDVRPRPRKIPFSDPQELLLNRGTSYWGSCVCPSPFPEDNGAARWVGQKQLYTPFGQEVATLQPTLKT
jgi:hypothetical protein